MATNYEDQFQRRYQETLAKLAEGTAAGQNPEEVFQMMQTARTTQQEIQLLAKVLRLILKELCQCLMTIWKDILKLKECNCI